MTKLPQTINGKSCKTWQQVEEQTLILLAKTPYKKNMMKFFDTHLDNLNFARKKIRENN